jgi:hypothetical protein
MNRLFTRSMKTILIALVIVGCAITFLAWASPASPPQETWLITPEEAALPPATPAARGLTGGTPFDIGRDAPEIGPNIEVVKPTEGATPAPPIEIAIRFTPRQQQIDLRSVKVSVVKFISIDITDRVRPYLSEQGIHIPDAKLPSGEHRVRISLSDVTGAATVRQATIKVP